MQRSEGVTMKKMPEDRYAAIRSKAKASMAAKVKKPSAKTEKPVTPSGREDQSK